MLFKTLAPAKPVTLTAFNFAVTLTGPSPCKMRTSGTNRGSKGGMPISGRPENERGD